jgi:hypothetical protein
MNEESGSFLKKRTKKLFCPEAGDVGKGAVRRRRACSRQGHQEQKVFCGAFLPEKRPLTFFHLSG